MSSPARFVAIDLGAGSGRLMLGQLDDAHLELLELHRFASQPVRLPGGLFSDVPHIWREIGAGLAAAAARCGGRIDGVGVDTWGVDFALLDAEGGLLGLPYHYRDELSSGMDLKAFEIVPKAEIFAATGIQFMALNTLYQLFGLQQRRPSFLAAAERLLFMPDLFTHWLGGDLRVERTIASTSQCYDPVRRDWAFPILDRLGLPRSLFGEVRDPGTVAGTLNDSVRLAAGLAPVPVLAPGGHDTALAVAAIPAAKGDFAYISSGTWSLVGTELDAPLINEAARIASFTNEIGVCNTVRFLKNVCGLWLVQESRRAWAAEGHEFSHADLARLAEAAPAGTAVIDVDAPEFGQPNDMPARIASYCRRSGQRVPETPGEVVRVALESLALRYRQVLLSLERLAGRRLAPLHIVGGGAQNRLLCQLTADATGRQVVAGPVEATAIGSVLMQALAVGRIRDLAHLREVVRRSFEVTRYEPRPAPGLEELGARLARLTEAPPPPEAS